MRAIESIKGDKLRSSQEALVRSSLAPPETGGVFRTQKIVNGGSLASLASHDRVKFINQSFIRNAPLP